MTLTLGEQLTIGSILVAVVTFIIRTSELAKRGAEDGKALKADIVGEVSKLRAEMAPVVGIAQEALRQATAAFRAVDQLREEHVEQRERWARLDERVKTERYEREQETLRWARATDKFAAPPDLGADK